MKTLAIIQARQTSNRLPNKVLTKIGSFNALEWIHQRLAKSKKIDKFVFAIPDNSTNDELKDFIKSKNFFIFRGSEKNVLERFYDCAKKYNPEFIVRLTADCPFIDARLLDDLIDQFSEKKLDYLANNHPPLLPDGFDAEIFTFDELERIINSDPDDLEKEHVTQKMRLQNKLSYNAYKNRIAGDFSSLRVTLDDRDDLKLLTTLVKDYDVNIDTSAEEIIKILLDNPKLNKINSLNERNEGMQMTNDEKLFLRAKKSISGGTSLLSKHPYQHHPKLWPTYFEKAKGVEIISKSNEVFIDMGLMGVGTNILGYSNPEINDAVIEAVSKGNMSTLNCFEEVELAEKLLEINPWADKCRFARSGGEANAISVRIARAFTGKDKVAICGYHGWHDWYISLSLSDNLKQHLVPGIKSKGIPKALKDSTVSFTYNNLKEFEKVIEENEDIGVVKMEVQRNFEPEEGFLEKIRDITKKKGIVLIFDECTTGFRETFGGVYKKFSVTPDMITFGKALGNGFAITAVLGKKEIMESFENTFISSTFWTERIGSVAALKTLELMEREESWKKIKLLGKRIKKIWKDLAEKNSLEIDITGLDALASYNFKELNLERRTYVVQKMLENKILSGNTFYPSTFHSSDHIDRYTEILDKIFKDLSQFNSKEKLLSSIKGDIINPNPFARAN